MSNSPPLTYTDKFLIKDLVDEANNVLPTRQFLRLLGSVTLVDNPANNSTDASFTSAIDHALSNSACTAFASAILSCAFNARSSPNSAQPSMR